MIWCLTPLFFLYFSWCLTPLFFWECYYNLSFIWLMGGLNPDHKTIAEFRRRNKRALKQVIRQCARLCIKLGLIEGNTLFVDSTRMRAHAAIQHSWTPAKARQVLVEIDQRIEKLLTECETLDQECAKQSWCEQAGQSSLAKG